MLSRNGVTLPIFNDGKSISTYAKPVDRHGFTAYPDHPSGLPWEALCMKENEKRIYEEPVIEIIEFTLIDSIATSGDFGSATLCGEQIY